MFAANPEHPGAAHYLIHAYDDPIHAPLGLRPARVYADIAPSASHALHMPSHIYFALGMWDDGAEMNERSYEAAKARTDARGEPLNGHGWHALVWLHYAYLQQGRFADADDLDEALVLGAALRVRPKAMTVVVILAGLFPLLIGTGTGSEVMQRLAAPMIGGMITAPLLSLFVLPALYKLLGRRRFIREELNENMPEVASGGHPEMA